MLSLMACPILKKNTVSGRLGRGGKIVMIGEWYTEQPPNGSQPAVGIIEVYRMNIVPTYE